MGSWYILTVCICLLAGSCWSLLLTTARARASTEMGLCLYVWPAIVGLKWCICANWFYGLWDSACNSINITRVWWVLKTLSVHIYRKQKTLFLQSHGQITITYYVATTIRFTLAMSTISQKKIFSATCPSLAIKHVRISIYTSYLHLPTASAIRLAHNYITSFKIASLYPWNT